MTDHRPEQRITKDVFVPGMSNRVPAAFICFILVNAVLFAALHHTHYKMSPDALVEQTLDSARTHTFTWWTARAYEDLKRAPDVVIVGSSQMGSATFACDAQMLQRKVDVLTHRRATALEIFLSRALGHRLNVFNGAQGGFMISDAYMMSRALFHGARKPKVVVLGISPRDFMDNSLSDVSSTEPFQFYSPCVNLGHLSACAFGNSLSYFQWLVNKGLPLRQLQPLTLTASEEHSLDASGTGHHGQCHPVQALCDICGDLRPGTLFIPANIPNGLVDNTREYEHRYQSANPAIYASERTFFRELLTFLKQSHIQVIVVGMPTLWTTREILPGNFWRDFRASVAQSCSDYGADWIDMLDAGQFDVNDFLDTVHLNATGGSKLFKLLAAHMSRDTAIASTLLARSGKIQVAMPEPKAPQKRVLGPPGAI